MERMVQFYNEQNEPIEKVEFYGETRDDIDLVADEYARECLPKGSWYEIKRYNKAIMEKYGI